MSCNKKKQRGGVQVNQYPAASPSTYSDSQSYMMQTVGKGNTQYDNVFMSNKSDGTGNAIVGLQGQRAGGKRRKGSFSKKNNKSRKGGYFGEVINQALVPAALIGMQQSYKKKKMMAGTRSRKRRNGGNFGEVINQALVPAAIIGMQQSYKKKKMMAGSKRRKMRKGGYFGEVINQALVPAAIIGMQQSYKKKKMFGSMSK